MAAPGLAPPWRPAAEKRIGHDVGEADAGEGKSKGGEGGGGGEGCEGHSGGGGDPRRAEEGDGADPVADRVAAEAHRRHAGREEGEGEAGGADPGAVVGGEVEGAPIQDGAFGDEGEEGHHADESRSSSPGARCRGLGRCRWRCRRRVRRRGGTSERHEGEGEGGDGQRVAGAAEGRDARPAEGAAEEAANAPEPVGGGEDRAVGGMLQFDGVGVGGDVHHGDAGAHGGHGEGEGGDGGGEDGGGEGDGAGDGGGADHQARPEAGGEAAGKAHGGHRSDPHAEDEEAEGGFGDGVAGEEEGDLRGPGAEDGPVQKEQRRDGDAPVAGGGGIERHGANPFSKQRSTKTMPLFGFA